MNKGVFEDKGSQSEPHEEIQEEKHNDNHKDDFESKNLEVCLGR